MSNTLEDIKKTTDSVAYFLSEKNKKYGDSALHPISVFSKHIGKYGDAVDKILVRLDDKVSRVMNAQEVRKNDIADMIGYLVFLCIGLGWTDFKDLLD